MSFELGFPYIFGLCEYSKCSVLFLLNSERGCKFLALKCYVVNKVKFQNKFLSKGRVNINELILELHSNFCFLARV